MLRTGGTKMILTVDIGNTTMTMGLYTPEGVLQFRGSIKTDKNKTRDQIAIDLLDMFQLYQADIRDVTGAVVSSVVPPMTGAMADAIRQLSGVRPMIVGPGVKTGMNILAEVHNQLGADIVASSVAALQKYPQPIIVIDMGTATTLSYLGESTYKGCVIIPGCASPWRPSPAGPRSCPTSPWRSPLHLWPLHHRRHALRGPLRQRRDD